MNQRDFTGALPVAPDDILEWGGNVESGSSPCCDGRRWSDRYAVPLLAATPRVITARTWFTVIFPGSVARKGIDLRSPEMEFRLTNPVACKKKGVTVTASWVVVTTPQ